MRSFITSDNTIRFSTRLPLPLLVLAIQVSHLLQSLSTEVTNRTAAEQESRDQLRSVHLETEQEKSRVLMLEETVSSLQHTVANNA